MPYVRERRHGRHGKRRDMSKPNYYYYKGNWYKLSDLALMCNVNYCTLQSRIRCGWSVARAIETPSKGHKLYSYDGMLYTVTELAKIHGDISPNTMQMRLDSGMSVEQAVMTPKQKGIPLSKAGEVKEIKPVPEKKGFVPQRSAADIKKCKKCRYSEKDSGGYTLCAYIILHSPPERRNCEPGKNCIRFEPRTRKSDRVKMAGSGWIREAR